MFILTAGKCVAGIQNKRVISGVRDVLQNSQKCRVLWHDRHKTHKSVRVLCTEPKGNVT